MMERNWGRVVFLSSESGLNIPADMIHYGFTKTANLSISRGLAKRLAGTGVTVNAVLPGPTLSEGVEAMLKESAEKSGQSDRGGGHRLREGEPAELDHPADRDARGGREHGGLCLLAAGVRHHGCGAPRRWRRGRHDRLIFLYHATLAVFRPTEEPRSPRDTERPELIRVPETCNPSPNGVSHGQQGAAHNRRVQMLKFPIGMYIAGAALLCLAVTATAQEAPPEPARQGRPLIPIQYTGTLKKIQDSGTIRLGHRENSIPFAFLDPNGKPIGYALDLCAAVVNEVVAELFKDIRVEYRAVTPENRFDLVTSKAIDLECGSTTNNAGAPQDLAFSPTMFVTGTKLMVRRGSGI